MIVDITVGQLRQGFVPGLAQRATQHRHLALHATDTEPDDATGIGRHARGSRRPLLLLLLLLLRQWRHLAAAVLRRAPTAIVIIAVVDDADVGPLLDLEGGSTAFYRAASGPRYGVARRGWSPLRTTCFGRLVIWMRVRRKDMLELERLADVRNNTRRCETPRARPPAKGSDLYGRITSHIQKQESFESAQVNPLVNIDPEYPLAVGIATGCLTQGVERASSQLASFGRCILRLSRDVAPEHTLEGDEGIILPLVTAVGSCWEVELHGLRRWGVCGHLWSCHPWPYSNVDRLLPVVRILINCVCDGGRKLPEMVD
ncbi:hypothetical protein SAMD00023353_0602530 [Rosellinia necatrix]|uniref:Uncharacterized protein n=1 Tax=Rosellinia necatrix TaxID=77044 RepID=A0A1S8A5R8_ROSNE|nr:hypothetical protein SAMD00023353_0602530 [Rosellinia necatrix]